MTTFFCVLFHLIKWPQKRNLRSFNVIARFLSNVGWCMPTQGFAFEQDCSFYIFIFSCNWHSAKHNFLLFPRVFLSCQCCKSGKTYSVFRSYSIISEIEKKHLCTFHSNVICGYLDPVFFNSSRKGNFPYIHFVKQSGKSYWRLIISWCMFPWAHNHFGTLCYFLIAHMYAFGFLTQNYSPFLWCRFIFHMIDISNFYL